MSIGIPAVTRPHEYKSDEAVVGQGGSIGKRARKALGLGSILLLASGLEGTLLAAQQALPARLGIQPRELATGTKRGRAGVQPLDSLAEGAWVYVPEQCVGSERCPLVVFLEAGKRRPAEDRAAWLTRYGFPQQRMLVLSPAPVPEPMYGSALRFWDDLPNVHRIAAALTRVLQTFAVDPDRIALVGEDGAATLVIGGDNLDVFSRVVLLDALLVQTGSVDSPPRAPAKPPEILIYTDLRSGWTLHGGIAGVHDLRLAGHRVKFMVGPRPTNPQEPYEYIGRWLHESWTLPDPAARPAPQAIADPLPLLSAEVLGKMIAFWRYFEQVPDSIKTAARRAHWREVAIPFGQEQASLLMADMTALAAKYPSVAAAFTAAGLTPKQYDAYRVAVMSAAMVSRGGPRIGKLDAASAIWKNVELRYVEPAFAEVVAHLMTP